MRPLLRASAPDAASSANSTAMLGSCLFGMNEESFRSGRGDGLSARQSAGATMRISKEPGAGVGRPPAVAGGASRTAGR